MRKTLELAIKCGVSESTVYTVCKRIHEKEKIWRYPTVDEIVNRERKKGGRPTKFKED